MIYYSPSCQNRYSPIQKSTNGPANPVQHPFHFVQQQQWHLKEEKELWKNIALVQENIYILKRKCDTIGTNCTNVQKSTQKTLQDLYECVPSLSVSLEQLKQQHRKLNLSNQTELRKEFANRIGRLEQYILHCQEEICTLKKQCDSVRIPTQQPPKFTYQNVPYRNSSQVLEIDLYKIGEIDKEIIKLGKLFKTKWDACFKKTGLGSVSSENNSKNSEQQSRIIKKNLLEFRDSVIKLSFFEKFSCMPDSKKVQTRAYIYHLLSLVIGDKI